MFMRTRKAVWASTPDLRAIQDGIDLVPAATLVTEMETNTIVAANAAAHDLFGRLDDLCGIRLHELVSPQADPVDALSQARYAGPAISAPQRYVRAGGSIFTGLTLVHSHPTLEAFSVCTIVDTTAAAQPDLDPLTGLVRRNGFTSKASQVQASGEPWGLFFVDLNEFKHVNDAHGHRYGDAVLAAAARRLEISVGSDDIVGRWGGDEFVVLVRNATSLAELSVAAQKIRDAFTHPLPVQPMVALTASIGAVLVEEDMSMADAIDRADAAMYDVKQRYLSDGELIRLCL